jgi:hypothetical protein
MNHPKQYMGYVAYLAQELVLDAATPGKVASDRLLTNAKLLRETVESWASYYNWPVKDLLAEVWKHDKEAEKRYAERAKKATGRRVRG